VQLARKAKMEDCFRALLTIQPFVASRKDGTLFITTKAKGCMF